MPNGTTTWACRELIFSDPAACSVRAALLGREANVAEFLPSCALTLNALLSRPAAKRIAVRRH